MEVVTEGIILHYVYTFQLIATDFDFVKVIFKKKKTIFLEKKKMLHEDYRSPRNHVFNGEDGHFKNTQVKCPWLTG